MNLEALTKISPTLCAPQRDRLLGRYCGPGVTRGHRRADWRRHRVPASRTIEHQIANLHIGWQGDSAQHHRANADQWQRSMSEMRAALTGLRSGVDGARTTYLANVGSPIGGCGRDRPADRCRHGGVSRVRPTTTDQPATPLAKRSTCLPNRSTTIGDAREPIPPPPNGPIATNPAAAPLFVQVPTSPTRTRSCTTYWPTPR